MATISPRMHARFDRADEFAAARQFTCGGVAYEPGQAFDKTKVNTRRLRQLYDSRWIRVVHTAQDAGTPHFKPRMPDFAGMSANGVRAWLESNKITIHQRASHQTLVTKAKLLWNQLNEAGT